MTDTDAKRARQAALHSPRRKSGALARRTMNSLCVIALLSPALAFASPPADKQSELLAHGKYIVDRVGMCADCHTPKDATGQPIKGEELHGAHLPFTPDNPIPGWTNQSIKIAGMPAGYTETQLVTFLETGRTRAGGMANPPMPPYRLNEHDARAVAAYLRSIN